MLPHGEEVLGGLEPRLDTKLVWRDAEDRLELADALVHREAAGQVP